jgi:hypothetical protein
MVKVDDAEGESDPEQAAVHRARAFELDKGTARDVEPQQPFAKGVCGAGRRVLSKQLGGRTEPCDHARERRGVPAVTKLFPAVETRNGRGPLQVSTDYPRGCPVFA